MISICNNVGIKTIGLISDMDQPLGFAVGNALEVEEAKKIVMETITSGKALAKLK